MADAWRCQHCEFEAFDEPTAITHARLFPGHGVLRRFVSNKLAENMLARRWVCEACPFETADEDNAMRHGAEQGGEHRCVLAKNAETHPSREQAKPGNTGPGALVTDGERLYEVTDCRRRKVKAGRRTLEVPERRLRDMKDELEDDPGGAWIPISEVLALEVVRAVEYDEPQPVTT